MATASRGDRRSTGDGTGRDATVTNTVLAAGFLLLTVGILAAWTDPARGYERSIYTETPELAWLGLLGAFAVAIAAVLGRRGPHRAAGVVLGGMATLAIVGLPAIRSYRFYGKADGLTHLGWTGDVLEGDLLLHELYYPALHGLSALLHELAGLEASHAMVVVVIVLFAPFTVFVPLVARQITGRSAAVGMAAAVSWFVLPVNNVATHLGAHTTTNALFFAPVPLFAAIAYMRREPRDGPGVRSSWSILLVVAAVGLLLIHPQQMANVVIVLGTVALLQQSSRRRSDHRALGWHVLLLGALFAVWSLGNERFRDALLGMVSGVFAGDIGAGAEVQQRGGSLVEVGGSLPEVFALLFGVSALVGLVVTLFVVLTLVGRAGLDRESRVLVAYLALSGIPLGAVFGLYFLGTPTMAFRQVGFVFVLVTILAGPAIASAGDWLSGGLPRTATSGLLAALLAGCLLLSLLVVFPSPVVYNPNQQSTDAMVSGYETALTGGDADTAYVGFGYGVDRYDDAIRGVEDRTDPVTGDHTVDPATFESGAYGDSFEDDAYYLVVTEYDEVREFTVWDQLSHSPGALAGLEGYPGTSRAVSNDEFRLYYVRSRG